MGARQSIDDRPRSNSVDASASLAPRSASRSALSTADLIHVSMRRNTTDGADSAGGSDEDNAQPGPSRGFHPRLPAASARRSHLSTHGASSHSRRSRLPHSHLSRRSMPLFVVASHDMNCPICHKTVASDEADLHLVMCLTRPKLTYNEDILSEAKGECSICLEDMEAGTLIARLPCLCIYHKSCIDDWFKRKNCCPEHPGDD